MDNKKHSPAFQFYPQDFIVGCADMSAEEVGGYIRLLCYQWTKGSLPNDNKKLMQLSGVFNIQDLESIKQKFTVRNDNTIVNLRLEKVRNEQEEYREKQRAKAQKRWESQNDATALPLDMPNTMPNECPSPSPSPSSSSSLSLPTSSNNNSGKSKRFIPPSLNEVQAYCIERGNKVDSQRFIDFYTSNGWQVGKNKMKDWKASVRTWEKNNFNTTQNGNTTKKTMDERLAEAANRIYTGSSEPMQREGSEPESFSDFEIIGQ